MANIYSKLLVSQHALSQYFVSGFPLSSTNITIIRCMDAFCPSVVGGSINVYDDRDVTFWSETVTDSADGAWVNWRGRQVFDPGAIIYVNSVLFSPLGGWDLRISGYELTPP